MAKKPGIHDTETVTVVSSCEGNVFVEDMNYFNAKKMLRSRDGVKHKLFQKDFTSMKSNVERRSDLLRMRRKPPPPPPIARKHKIPQLSAGFIPPPPPKQ